MPRRSRIIIVVMLSALLYGCNVTRHVPRGEYFLIDNNIDIIKSDIDDRGVSKDKISNYIYQDANKKFLWTYFPQFLYNLPDSTNKKLPARWARRIGRESVLLDTISVRSSMLNIGNYMTSHGYFDYRGDYVIDTAKKRATVTYRLQPGRPHRVGSVSYEFRDKAVAPLILGDTAGRLFNTGDIYDQSRLDGERSRIADYLKDRGYYSFSVNNISYIADSTSIDHTINIRVVVKKNLIEYTESGEPIMENNMVYMIREVRIVPDYDPSVPDHERIATSLDTLDYMGLRIIYSSGEENIRKEVLRRVVNLYPNYFYNASQVRHGYDKLLGLGYFRNANITFTEVESDGSPQEFVSYTGSAAESTAVGYFICTIICTPGKHYALSAELEGSISSSFYAISPKLGFRNQNTFRGTELLTTSLWGSYEFLKRYRQGSSYEIGASVGLAVPRFVSPIKIDRFNKLSNPQTKADLSYTFQNKPYYQRSILSANWSYSWGNNKHSSFQLRPIDISLVKMDYIDSTFMASLENPYLINSYQSQLIPGISGSYLYNRTNARGSNWQFRVNAETMGNTINVLCRIFSDPTTDGKDSYYKIFGVRFSQYARADLSLSRKFALGHRSSIVARIYGGYAYKYGNGLSIPYDRLFYSGGSYSMRGWLARTLGPGSELLPDNTLHPYQVGSVKLEANLEGRFPIWGVFNGALFFDAGNVWNTKQNSTLDQGVFHWNNFYKQLGFNTGLGLRIDITFVVVRIDWGIKLHNPNLPTDRWINNFRLRNTTLNFGVGYPF